MTGVSRFRPRVDMVDYIPILTTLFSAFFLSRIVPHYLLKRSPYLLWWTLGVLTFGLGTATKADRVVVEWPSGKTDEITNLPAGKAYVVVEGKGVTP